MFNWFSKFGRKKNDAASYEEAEKLLTSSLHAPMKPTDSFKFSLKDKLLAHFSGRGTNPLTGRGFRWVGSSVVAAIAVLAVGSYLYFRAPNLFREIPLVKAGATDVSVNFPVRAAFPLQELDSAQLQKFFEITPKTEGVVMLAKGVLTFDHPKNLRYETDYTIKVAKAASAELAEDFTVTFKTRKRFAADLYLSSYMNLAHYTLNYYDEEPEVLMTAGREASASYAVHLYKISADDLVNFVTAAERNFFDGKEDKNKELLAALRKNRIEAVTIKAEQKDEYTRKVVYKPGVKEPGTYFVEMGDSRFFLTYTRYGLSSKRIGTKLATWMVDMKTGESVPGAAVKIINQKNEVVGQGKTDERGIHDTEISQDFENYPMVLTFEANGEKIAHLVRVRYRNIFDVDWGNRDQKYTGYAATDRPLYAPGDTVKFKIFLRKTGEPDYDGSIRTARVEVKRETFGAPVESVFDSEFPVSSMGTFDGEFALGKELKTGEYWLKVSVGGEESVHARFNVEVYQKPEFEVIVKPERDRYVSGDDIKFSVNARYFFGTPVAGQKVNVTLVATYFYGDLVAETSGTLDQNGNFNGVFKEVRKSFRDFGYNNFDPSFPFVITARVKEDTGKSVTGKATINFYSSEYRVEREEPKDLWRLKPREAHSFIFRVRNVLAEGEQEVPGAAIKLKIRRISWEKDYNRREEIIFDKGFTADQFGKVQFMHEFSEGGSYEILVSAKDPRGNEVETLDYVWIPDAENGMIFEPTPGSNTLVQITLQPEKDSYRVGESARITAFLPQQEGDLFVSAYTTQMRRMFTKKISGNTETLIIPVTEDFVPGFYVFAEVFNGDSFFHGSRFIEVAGKKLNIEITPSAQQFYPKERVTLEIRAKDEDGNPAATEGAVSVIDKAILALKSFNDETMFNRFYRKPGEWYFGRLSNTDAFVIGTAEKGGCFLAGTLILMADGTMKPIEEIKFGDVILTRENENSSRLVKDTVVRTFRHEVSEYLIINGMLKVTPVHRMFVSGEWKTASEIRIGDWLSNPKGGHIQVNSIEKVSTVVPVYNFETRRYHTYFANGIYVHNNKGGDERPRSEFLDTAYWNALVQTGSDGRGEVSFDVPDNLTTWVAMAKNITRDTKVGEGQGEFIVTKDLFIRPALPLFFRATDEAEIPAVIHNNTPKDLTVKALIKAEGATIVNETLRELSIPANGTAQIVWNARIDSAREAKFSFSVNEVGGQLVDNLEHIIPIYSPLSKETTVFTGAAPESITVPFEKNASNEFGGVLISLHASTVSLLPGVIAELTGFPYGCVEQTMSSHLPNVLVKKYSRLLGMKVPDDMSKNLKEGLDRLSKYQHEDGSFGWWEADDASIWMTGYVIEGFLEMKELEEFAGREGMQTRVLEYLKNRLPELKGLERIYAWYVLSRAEPGKHELKIDDSELAGLPPEFHGYIALAHKLNGNEAKAKRVVKDFIMPKLVDHHWEQADEPKDGHDMSMADRYLATGVNLLALLEVGGADESVNKKEIKSIVQWLMNNRMGYHGLWGSTRQSSQILFALIKFVEKYDELSPDLDYEILLNGEKLESGRADGGKFNKNIEIPSEKLREENKIEFSSTGKGTLYYTVKSNHFTAEPISTGGESFKIERRYLKNGQPVTEFEVGDIIKVELAITNPQALPYVMVEDELPSGFDVINDRLDQNAPYYGDEGPGYYWSDPMDFRDSMVAIFDQYVYGGRTFSYRMRAARRGTFAAPASRATPMYEPLTFAAGKPQIIKVK